MVKCSEGVGRFVVDVVFGSNQFQLNSVVCWVVRGGNVFRTVVVVTDFVIFANISVVFMDKCFVVAASVDDANELNQLRNHSSCDCVVVSGTGRFVVVLLVVGGGQF